MGTVAWNPRNVSLPEPQLPPPQPDVQTSSTHSYPPQSSAPTNNAVTTAAPEPKLVQFTPMYSPVNEGERASFIPRNFADGSQPKQHSTAGLEADDPRRSLIDQGYQVQDIDREANALADQILDVEGARGKVKTAAGNEEQFWQGFYSKLTPQQNKELQSLAEAIETSPDKAAARASFDNTISPLLSTEQRTQLQTLQRRTQDAQIELNDQTIGKRLRDAQLSGNAEQLSLATADARVHISDKQQLIANRKVEDAYALVMTPENQQTLAAPQKALIDAVQKLSLNPSDKTAQQGVKDAKKALDDAQAQALSAEDKKIIDTLEAASERERDLGSLLVQECATEHRYVELSGIEKQRPLNETEKRILDLAKLDFDVMQKNRGVRDIAVQAANAEEGDERSEVLKDLDTKLTDFMRAKSDADIKRAEFTKDVAQTQSATVGKEFATDMPSTDLTLDQANKNLDAIKQQRDELEEMLKPPPAPKKSGWDRALEFIAGAVEIVGGVTLGLVAGWTGVGGVASIAIIADGGLRLAHSFADAFGGTTTDTWQSQAFQAMGASRETANRIDTGLNLVATVPVGAGFAAFGAVKASTMLMKGVNAAGCVSVLDGAQAGARYMATGEHANAFMVDGLMAAGLSQTQANYVLMGANLIATGSAVAAARGRSAPAAQPTTSTTTTTVPATTATQTTGSTAATSGTTGTSQAATSTGTSASTGTTQTANTSAASSATNGTQASGTTGTATGPSANTGSTNSGTNNVSSNQPGVNASGLDPSSNPWGPDGKGGKGVSLLVNHGNHPQTNVAILGSSHVAITTAADILLNGGGLQPKVLFRGNGLGRDRISEVAHPYDIMETLHTKQSQVVDLEPRHFGYADSAEGHQALQEAGFIIVTIPDKPLVRLELFHRLQQDGLVQDPGKTIMLVRGGQAGQPVLSQMIRENWTWNSSVVLVEDSMYGTRVNQATGPNGLPTIRAKRKDDVEVSVLARGGDNSTAMAQLREIFPLSREGRPWPNFNVVPGIDMPWRAGYYIHPGVAFDPVNLAKTQRGEVYLHYAQGVHPELGRMLERIDAEMVQIADRFGVHAHHFKEKLFRQFGLAIQDEPFDVTMARTGPKEMGGEGIYLSESYPTIEKLMNSRYPTEDVPGLFTINWFAELSGGRLPAHIAYEAQIRQTLRDLGMPESQMRNELGAYLPYLDAMGDMPPADLIQLLNEPHMRPDA